LHREGDKPIPPYNVFNMNGFKLYGLKKEPYKLTDLFSRVIGEYQTEVREGREHVVDINEIKKK